MADAASSNPLDMFAIPASSAAFDDAAMSEFGQSREAVRRSEGGANGSALGIQVPSAFAFESSNGFGNEIGSRGEAIDTVRRLALLRQDIAGLGGMAGLDRLNWSQRSDLGMIQML